VRGFEAQQARYACHLSLGTRKPFIRVPLLPDAVSTPREAYETRSDAAVSEQEVLEPEILIAKLAICPKPIASN